MAETTSQGGIFEQLGISPSGTVRQSCEREFVSPRPEAKSEALKQVADFAVGDVVSLKTGERSKMTVERIDGIPHIIRCVFFEDNRVIRLDVPPDDLQFAEPEAPK
jgi:hypothetical protein